jgi:hypothetical protein
VILLTCIWFEYLSGHILPRVSSLKSSRQILGYYLEVEKLSYSLQIAFAINIASLGGLPTKTNVDMQVCILSLKKACIITVFFFYVTEYGCNRFLPNLLLVFHNELDLMNSTFNSYPFHIFIVCKKSEDCPNRPKHVILTFL